MYTHGALVICMLVVGCASSPRSDYSGHSIHPDTKTNWGVWGTTEWCPHGTFAKDFSLRIEGPQGDGDDTALNSIALYCRAPECQGSSGTNNWIYSLRGSFGTYHPQSLVCPYGYMIVGAQARSQEVGGGDVDDNAATNYKFQCRHMTNGLTHTLFGRGPRIGTWGNMKACPSGTAICGLQTQVEPVQGGSEDDTALNDAIFYCCKLPNPCNL